MLCCATAETLNAGDTNMRGAFAGQGNNLDSNTLGNCLTQIDEPLGPSLHLLNAGGTTNQHIIVHIAPVNQHLSAGPME